MPSGESELAGTMDQSGKNNAIDQSLLNPARMNTLSLLNTLIDESMQIYELEDQKTNIIENTYNSLKVITEFLGFSIVMQPSIFNFPTDTNIVLLPNLDLIVKFSNGKTETKKFVDYPPETITEIIEFLIPQILELIKSQKTYLTENILFLRTATRQLNTLSQMKENLPTKMTTETNETIV
jgi:hypothetical protein